MEEKYARDRKIKIWTSERSMEMSRRDLSDVHSLNGLHVWNPVRKPREALFQNVTQAKPLRPQNFQQMFVRSFVFSCFFHKSQDKLPKTCSSRRDSC